MKIRPFFLYFLGIMVSPLSLGTEAEEALENQPGPPFTLSVDNNSLTFKGNGAYLGEVLEELRQQTQIKVQIAGSAAEEKVLVSFEEVPMAQGIKLLLKGRNYVLTYAEPVTRNAALTSQKVSEIRVLPDAEEAANAVPEKQPTSEKQSNKEDTTAAEQPPSENPDETEKKDVDFGPN